MLHWYHSMIIWIGHLDRTETIVVMTIGVVVGTYCLRGMSAKLR